MRRLRSRQAAGVAVLVLVGVLGVLLAVFGLSGNDSTPGPTASSGSATETAIPPLTGGAVSTTAEGAIVTRSFTVVLPKEATGVAVASTQASDRVTFSVGDIKGAVSGQESFPGQSFQDLITLYGSPRAGERTTLAGKPAYLFVATTGGQTSAIIVGRVSDHDYAVQLLGPDAGSVRELAPVIAASIEPH